MIRGRFGRFLCWIGWHSKAWHYHGVQSWAHCQRCEVIGWYWLGDEDKLDPNLDK